MDAHTSRRFVLTAILIVAALPSVAQELPRVAVVPFKPIQVSEGDALAVTVLFETGLVQTNAFSVIEQSQIQEIVEAQQYSLSDCTDESCAVEVGKLVAAQQIILGTLSSIGGKFVLSAKIIDVESGTNISADSVESDNLAEMTGASKLLAFKLAGLTYAGEGEVTIADQTGEVLVQTDPSEAEIFVNGRRRGTSPELISNIPFGPARIEVRKDGEEPRELPLLEQAKWYNAWLIEQFTDWLDGGEPMVTNVEDNLQSVAMVFAAAESARTGQPVKVQEFLENARREVLSAM